MPFLSYKRPFGHHGGIKAPPPKTKKPGEIETRHKKGPGPRNPRNKRVGKKFRGRGRKHQKQK